MRFPSLLLILIALSFAIFLYFSFYFFPKCQALIRGAAPLSWVGRPQGVVFFAIAIGFAIDMGIEMVGSFIAIIR